MSIVYRVDREKGVTLVLWDGVVTAEDFLAHARRLSSDTDWPPRKYLHLSDVRLASLDASMVDAIIEKVAVIYAERSTAIAKFKVAIVASEAFGRAVVFERTLARYGASVIVFNTLGTASKWLGIDTQEVERSLKQLFAQARGRTDQQDRNADAAADG